MIKNDRVLSTKHTLSSQTKSIESLRFSSRNNKLAYKIVLRIQIVVQIMWTVFQTGYTCAIVFANLIPANVLIDLDNCCQIISVHLPELKLEKLCNSKIIKVFVLIILNLSSTSFLLIIGCHRTRIIRNIIFYKFFSLQFHEYERVCLLYLPTTMST